MAVMKIDPSSQQFPRSGPNATLGKLGRDNGGSVAMIAAIVFPVLIGGMGLGAEVGLWYVSERKLQSAADVAAYAAAVRLNNGDAKTKLDEVALNASTKSGFIKTRGTIAVNVPPTSGPSAGDTSTVEVLLKEDVDRYFTSFFASNKVQVHGRAVARTISQQICALALNTTANSALAVKGSASATFNNCIVSSNSTSSSSVDMQGSAKFTGDCIYAAGGFTQGGSSSVSMTKCEGVETNSAPVRDPYSDVTVPTTATGCVSGNLGSNNANTTVTPTLTHETGVPFIRYCSLSLNGHVTFKPGLYIVDGAMSSNGQSITGTGVTFVVGGNVSLTGNLVLNISAPTSGPFSGLAFFGDRDATVETAKITGTSGSVIQGAVYLPTGDLEYTGSSAVNTGCTQVIANTISFNGNSDIRSSCATAGTRTLANGISVVLSE